MTMLLITDIRFEDHKNQEIFESKFKRCFLKKNYTIFSKNYFHEKTNSES